MEGKPKKKAASPTPGEEPAAEQRDLSWVLRLDELLDKSGLTNETIGARLGLQNATISRYRSIKKSTHRDPPPEVLAAMIEMAGGSADEVLGLKPVGSVPSRSTLIDMLGNMEAELRRLRELMRRA